MPALVLELSSLEVEPLEVADLESKVDLDTSLDTLTTAAENAEVASISKDPLPVAIFCIACCCFCCC